MARARLPQNYSLPFFNMAVVREVTEIQKVRTPADAAEICADIARLQQETFVILMLNAKLNMIDRRLISLGIVDASLVHPREVFREAIKDSATQIVLVHNHPSGQPDPSTEDVRVTVQLVKAGKIIDIPVVDHVIVAPAENHNAPKWSSMREEGLVEFT